MTNVSSPSELLIRWQELQKQGQKISIEQLCAESPEMLDQLKQQIEALQSMESFLGVGLAGVEASTDGTPNSGNAESITPFPGDDQAVLPGEPADSRVAERFVVKRQLGAGGMGVVYEAYDRQRGELVALKTMRHMSPAALIRFKGEFRTLADVTHPNLVALYELFSLGNRWFFTMELVDGVRFPEYIRGVPEATRPRPASHDHRYAGLLPTLCVSVAGTDLSIGSRPDIARLRAALRQLAEGLCTLHDAGKLHRDVKPSNVLVMKNGRVVLLDFGLATDLSRQRLQESTDRNLVGTLMYMAPELVASMPLSPASDWYSVGVMLYELLTGRPPFSGNLLESLMAKQLVEPPPPSQLVSDIPSDLDTLCMDLLNRSPEARPSGRDVLHRLGAAPAEPALFRSRAASPIHHMPFVGRERHLKVLRDAFALVQQGRSVSVYIRGKSGLGKSALLQRFLDSLVEADEAAVLAGRCYEHESVPYKAVDSLVDALSRYLRKLPRLEAEVLMPRDIQALVRVFPVLQRVEALSDARRRIAEIPDHQELRRRAFAALRELLSRLGDRRPLVLSIDDLQWGDVDSAALVAELLRPPDPPVLLLLGCYRSEDTGTSPFLRALAEISKQENLGADWRELAVETLAPAEAQQLAAALVGSEGADTPATVEAIVRESGGNPFFLQELVQYVQHGDNLEPETAPTGKIALDDVLWRRIMRLPERPRRLLEVLAVAGRPLCHSEALRAAGLDAREHVAAVLRSARLVRSTSYDERNELETYHDRIRETVIAHLSAVALQDNHRRLAVTLESTERVDSEVLAIHFHGAGEPDKATDYYVLAADQASETLAFERAARLYRTALELRAGDRGAARGLRTRLGDALANAGRGKEAAEEYLTATAGADIAQTLDVQRRAAMQYLISGHLAEGLDVLRGVLSAVGMTLPRTSRRALWPLLLRRLQLWLRGLNFRQRESSEIPPDDLTRIDVCWSAALGLSVVDHLRGAYFNTRELLLALDAGEPHRLCRALAIEAGHVAGIGGVQSQRRTARLLGMADRVAQHIAQPYSFGSVSLAKGIVAFFEGRWKQAHQFCDHAESIFRDSCTGVAWELDTAQAFSVWSLTHMGNVAELTTRWPVLLKEARERGDLYAETNMSMGIMPLVRLAANDPAGASRDLREVMKRWPRQGFHDTHAIRVWDEGQIDLYMGQPSVAWTRLSNHWTVLSKSFVLQSQGMRIFMVHLHARSALAAAAGTDSKRLLAVAEKDARRLEREKAPWSSALAQLIRAGVASSRRDTTCAVTLLDDAIKRLEAVDMLLYAAAARRRLGEIKGGDSGSRSVQDANSWMAAQGIQDPTRMTSMLLGTA